MGHGTKYTNDQKLAIAAAWSLCADDAAIAQGFDVKIGTLKTWKREVWWRDALLEIQSKQSQRLIAKCHRALDTALDALQDRVEYGDEIVLAKGKDDNGDLITIGYRVPVKARDLSAIVNTLATRSEKAAGMAADIETNHQLSDLQTAFRQFSRSYRAKQVTDSKAIEHDSNGLDSTGHQDIGQEYKNQDTVKGEDKGEL